ncbi:hypothetical protein GH714_043221 [Hevea brasiliensis]|uniref:Uncharacterized protein n=1 Tax=Hevea brasiliensis TaxID=3981 RepID=A0A6A6K1H3_HEVBR|nr:hypothetical protein GH714_043221 [Hevea brasiliensis]
MKQLAVAVRSIQWSYAIFWSLSTWQKGVLEWVDGYYNGDIKTRKTVQAMELKNDKIELQSEQLRELYKSLHEGEIDQQAKRPSAALSPEDLSDAECLPGRALANKETIWLCNAQYADSNSLALCLPRSPNSDGLLCSEIDVQKLLVNFILQTVMMIKDPVCAQVDCETVDALAALEDLCHPTEDIMFNQEGIDELQENMHEELNMDSSDDCSNGFEKNHQTEDSILESLNGGTSHAQCWHFVGDELRGGVEVHSSDCITEDIASEENTLSCPKDKNVNHLQLKELKEGNHSKLSSLDLGASDNLHYKRTLSTVLGSSTQLIANSCFCSRNQKSSFVNWKKGAFNGHRPQLQQNMLKKILFTVPLIHSGHSLRPHIENGGKDCCRKLKSNEICRGLKLMIHSVGEINKASILDDMIRYLKELEARVEELESCMDSVEYTERPRRNDFDMAEQTSDNYENKATENGKKLWLNKRKASDIYVTDPELNEMYILLDIMDEINNLHLDVHSVQSSTIDGILTVTLKSKFCAEGQSRKSPFTAFSSYFIVHNSHKLKSDELHFSFKEQQLHLLG